MYFPFDPMTLCRLVKQVVAPDESGPPRLGSRGEEVRLLQTTLNMHGAFPPVDEDGVFDEDTDHALREFQASHGLRPNGIAGKSTWTRLQEPPPLDEVCMDEFLCPPLPPSVPRCLEPDHWPPIWGDDALPDDEEDARISPHQLYGIIRG